jgi:hypothetical protein
MEGFCFVISTTGLNRPNSGKDDEQAFVIVTVAISLLYYHPCEGTIHIDGYFFHLLVMC